MATEHNDDSRSVALYWDFENLHAGLMEAKGEAWVSKGSVWHMIKRHHDTQRL